MTLAFVLLVNHEEAHFSHTHTHTAETYHIQKLGMKNSMRSDKIVLHQFKHTNFFNDVFISNDI